MAHKRRRHTPEEEVERTLADGTVRNHHRCHRPAVAAGRGPDGHHAAARLSRSAAARRMWRLATLVNFIGPASYFTFGVKRRPGAK